MNAKQKDSEWDSKVICSNPTESIQKLGNTFHRKLIKDQSNVDSLTEKSEGINGGKCILISMSF